MKTGLKKGLWATLLGVGGAAAAFEVWYRTRETKPCLMLPAHRHPWRTQNFSDTQRVFRTNIPIRNFNTRYEATVVDVKPTVKVLAKKQLPTAEELKVTVNVKPWHSDTREDGYWPAYILSPQSTLEFELAIQIEGELERLADIHAIVVDLDYITYSRESKVARHEEVVLIPHQEVGPQPEPQQEGNVTLQPIKTHILTDADNMADVIAQYVSPLAQPGDIVVMAESVVAITQRRYLIPDEHVKPGFWASRLCYLIPNVGSLSSRYGMQCAINEVGLPRMLSAMAIGAAMKGIGQNGWLYRIAGVPSELIDDITGTMPPFDKYIVLGPAHAQSVVNEVRARTGLEAAIADVNNLRKAAIISATKGVNQKALIQALLSNPSGNGNEQTPIVVVRLAEQTVESSRP